MILTVEQIICQDWDECPCIVDHEEGHNEIRLTDRSDYWFPTFKCIVEKAGFQVEPFRREVLLNDKETNCWIIPKLFDVYFERPQECIRLDSRFFDESHVKTQREYIQKYKRLCC